MIDISLTFITLVAENIIGIKRAYASMRHVVGVVRAKA
jgi:hypothetical protein